MTWFNWQERPSPFTGFGDDQNTSVKFVHFTGWRDPLPDWQGGDAKLSYHPIANSDIEVTQYHGRESQELELRIWLATGADLALLHSMVGQRATLRYRVGSVLTNADGSIKTIGNTDYVILPDTILANMTDRGKPALGFPEATVTFRRPYVSSPYVGFATVSEDI